MNDSRTRTSKGKVYAYTRNPNETADNDDNGRERKKTVRRKQHTTSPSIRGSATDECIDFFCLIVRSGNVVNATLPNRKTPSPALAAIKFVFRNDRPRRDTFLRFCFQTSLSTRQNISIIINSKSILYHFPFLNEIHADATSLRTRFFFNTVRVIKWPSFVPPGRCIIVITYLLDVIRENNLLNFPLICIYYRYSPTEKGLKLYSVFAYVRRHAESNVRHWITYRVRSTTRAVVPMRRTSLL